MTMSVCFITVVNMCCAPSRWAQVLAVVTGVIIAVAARSAATLGFALENAVDTLSSVLVLWRFWGGGTVPEHVLESREKRASIGIGCSFVILAIVVGGVAARNLALAHEPDEVTTLIAFAAPSAVIFAVRAGRQPRHGARACVVASRCPGPGILLAQRGLLGPRFAPAPTRCSGC